jgi:type IV pilus assembly protein PilC
MPSIDLSRYEQKKKGVAPDQPNGEKPSGLMDLLNKEITFGSAELADKKKEQFYLELSSLLKAGINLKSSLELMVGEQQKAKEQVLFETIKSSVVKGSSLSRAIADTGKFSKYEVFTIEIGEESGKLTEVLEDIASFYQHKIKQRRKIVSALTYPAVVLTTSLGAVFFMLKFVVPVFGDVFKRFGGKLPWITEKMIALSAGTEHYFLPVVIVAAVISGFLFSQRKKDKYQELSARIVLKIPLAGELVRKIYLARFCNSMRLLINARLPLLRAIALSRQMTGYYPISSSLAKVEADILSGRSLHQSLQQYKIYPPKMIQLLRVGEETNKLDYFFGKIAEQYVEEVEYKTSALTQVMEPLIIVFLGLVVGTILIAMYLPLFEMSNNIG